MILLSRFPLEKNTSIKMKHIRRKRSVRFMTALCLWQLQNMKRKGSPIRPTIRVSYIGSSLNYTAVENVLLQDKTYCFKSSVCCLICIQLVNINIYFTTKWRSISQHQASRLWLTVPKHVKCARVCQSNQFTLNISIKHI